MVLPLVDLVPGVELLGIGLAAGVLGGLLGIGGGIVMIPALWLLLGEAFGADSFHVYKLAAISTSLVLSLPAVLRHQRAGAIVWGMVPGLVPLALVGVLAGVLLAGTMTGGHTATLRRLFGVFLELVILVDLYQEWCRRRGADACRCAACPLPRRRWLIGTVAGLPAGLIAGLLGVGGGIWAVPAQRLLLGVLIRHAIANSAVMILFVSLATAVGLSVFLAGLPPASAQAPPLYVGGWGLMLWLAPGALVGGWCGAGLTHRLPVRWLRYAFLAVLGVTGVRLMLA